MSRFFYTFPHTAPFQRLPTPLASRVHSNANQQHSPPTNTRQQDNQAPLLPPQGVSARTEAQRRRRERERQERIAAEHAAFMAQHGLPQGLIEPHPSTLPRRLNQPICSLYSVPRPLRLRPPAQQQPPQQPERQPQRETIRNPLLPTPPNTQIGAPTDSLFSLLQLTYLQSLSVPDLLPLAERNRDPSHIQIRRSNRSNPALNQSPCRRVSSTLSVDILPSSC